MVTLFGTGNCDTVRKACHWLVSHAATNLMLAHPTLIKRPILEPGDILQPGFSEVRYRQLFGISEMP
ncbi:MAG: ArsC/Spx/MgsR family protein [Gammaproteobacteria bacterium]|jgi:arsenate reductase-like glutaredoxin family protein